MKRLVTLLAAVGVLVAAALAAAQTPASARIARAAAVPVFNAKSYGAVGNGSANDTPAIDKANDVGLQAVDGYRVSNSANTGGKALRIHAGGSTQVCPSAAPRDNNTGQ